MGWGPWDPLLPHLTPTRIYYAFCKLQGNYVSIQRGTGTSNTLHKCLTKNDHKKWVFYGVGNDTLKSGNVLPFVTPILSTQKA